MTVTVNAALDVTYEAERFVLGRPNRVPRVRAQAGGKGINVARVLEQLGIPAVVTGFAGGRTGEAMREELAAAGLRDELVPCAAESRRTVTLRSLADDVTTPLNEEGAPVREEEWEALAGRVEALLDGARALVLAGSVREGVPEDGYARLAAAARARRVPAVVDASGRALLAALPARPALVKPNRDELAEVAGLPSDAGPAEVAAAAGALRRGGAEAVVASLDADGLLGVTEAGIWRARGPRLTGNPTGAGDAVVAGLVAGLLAGEPWPERLRRATALGAAAVRHPVAGRVDEDARRQVEPQVAVEALTAG